MPDDPHVGFQEALAAYALGALEAAEAGPLEAHLAGCADCRAELAAYRAVSAGLGQALAPRPPSAKLRRQLQARLPSAARSLRRPAPAWNWGRLAVGLALVVLLGLNAAAGWQLRSLSVQLAQVQQAAALDRTVSALAADPAVERVSIGGAGATGALWVARERQALVLLLRDLPALTDAQTFQIWLIGPQGQRTSAGLFRAQAGQAYTTVSLTGTPDLTGFTGLGVTIEPAAGSPQPTGPRVFKVDY